MRPGKSLGPEFSGELQPCGGVRAECADYGFLIGVNLWDRRTGAEETDVIYSSLREEEWARTL